MIMVQRFLDDGKAHEATVWVTSGNNIIVMLCALHNLTFRVEDRMLNEFASTAGDLAIHTGVLQIIFATLFKIICI